jgi:hypothetical protein
MRAAHWHSLSLRKWCVMASRTADRVWLICAENTIVIAAPSLIALVVHAMRYGWRCFATWRFGAAQLINELPQEAEKSF